MANSVPKLPHWWMVKPLSESEKFEYIQLKEILMNLNNGEISTSVMVENQQLLDRFITLSNRVGISVKI